MSLIPFVLAHEGGELVNIGVSLSQVVRTNQITFTLVATAIIFILTTVAIILYKKSSSGEVVQEAVTPTPATVTPPTTPAEVSAPSAPPPSTPVTPTEPHQGWKMPLFLAIVLVVVANTLYLVGSTLYVNAKSVTNGPIHWHADYQVWDCGKEIELIDPKPPSNKVGSLLLHEHNDKRIHVEEAVFDPRNISLGAFFIVVGGDLHSDYLKFPTNNGVVERRNGDLCPDGQPGTLQVFLYKAGSFNQQKLADPQDYMMTPEQKVPPGDCIIVEFNSPKENTDHLCQSYRVAKEKRENGR